MPVSFYGLLEAPSNHEGPCIILMVAVAVGAGSRGESRASAEGLYCAVIQENGL